jgi:hypothetical protein
VFRPTRHLACLLLLISSFGAAQAARAQNPVFRGNYIDALLYRQSVAVHTLAQAAQYQRVREQKAEDTAALKPRALATARTPWTMRPAAQQAAAVHALTALPRA